MIATEKTIEEQRTAGGWDVEHVREDFPVLRQTVNGKPLVYLDNAASAQVPRIVIERGSKYLREEHSNIHRGVHYLSQRATSAYEGAREKVKRFLGAREARECIFVRGVTEVVAGGAALDLPSQPPGDTRPRLDCRVPGDVSLRRGDRGRGLRNRDLRPDHLLEGGL